MIYLDCSLLRSWNGAWSETFIIRILEENKQRRDFVALKFKQKKPSQFFQDGIPKCDNRCVLKRPPKSNRPLHMTHRKTSDVEYRKVPSEITSQTMCLAAGFEMFVFVHSWGKKKYLAYAKKIDGFIYEEEC